MKGELVYIPCETVLHQFVSEANRQISLPITEKCVRIKRPVNVLVLDNNPVCERFLKVLYGGQSWYVDKAYAREVSRC